MRIIISIIFCFLVACDRDTDCPKNSRRSIEVINRSSKRIYLITLDDRDSSLLNITSPVNLSKFIIKPDRYTKLFADPIRHNVSCWESMFKHTKKLILYFLDADVIEQVSWEEVQKNNTGLLERREIDLDYCIQNNWQINFK